MADNQVDLKLNLDFKGVNDALYQMIGQFNGTDKEFQKIANSIEKNAKNLEAAIKLFGPASQQASSEVKKLQRDFQSLVAQGIDPASDSFKKMSASIPTPGKIDATANSVKKSNMQYTNLALVLQDLPYGFRGIQNNLPALIGGMAGVTGAFYLAASAAIALYTAYDMGLFKSKEATEKAKEKTEALKKQKDATDSLYDSTAQEAAQVGVLMAVIKSETETRNRKLTALKDLKEINPSIFDGLTLEKNAVVGLDEAYKNYLENLGTIIAVKTKQAELELIIAKRLKAEGATLSQEEKDITATGAALDSALNTKRTDLELRTRSTKQQVKEAKQQVYINGLLSQEEKITRNIQQLSSGIKLKDPKNEVDTKKIKGKTAEQIAEERLKAIEKANNAEIKAYTESLDERDKKEYEAGLKLAENLQIMRNAGYTDSTTYYTAYRAEMDKIATYYNNKEIEESRKTSEKIAHDAEVINNRQLQNSLDALKIESDVAMKIANLSGTANASDRIKILEDYKNKLYDLASTGGYTAEQFDKIDDALLRVDAAIDGSKDKVKDYTITWQETSNTINGILTNLVRDSIVKFSENIGKALAGEGTNPFQGFGEMIADAAIGIGKALIAYGVAITAFAFAVSDPFAAIAAGAALVIAGSYLKSRLSKQNKGAKPTAFADGGIISGPTMGLMGEYPGASHNPEVVAPLDKLKSLIGGGGGTLEARISGNDLLILMNKASRNNNNTF